MKTTSITITLFVMLLIVGIGTASMSAPWGKDSNGRDLYCQYAGYVGGCDIVDEWGYIVETYYDAQSSSQDERDKYNKCMACWKASKSSSSSSTVTTETPKTDTSLPSCDRLNVEIEEDINTGVAISVSTQVTDICDYNPLAGATLHFLWFHIVDDVQEKMGEGFIDETTVTNAPAMYVFNVPITTIPGDVYRVDVYATKDGYDESYDNVHIIAAEPIITNPANIANPNSGDDDSCVGYEDLIGTWKLSEYNTPNDGIDEHLKFYCEAGEIKGVQVIEGEEYKLTIDNFDGVNIRFNNNPEGMTGGYSYTGTLNGNTMGGEVSTGDRLPGYTPVWEAEKIYQIS